MTEPMVELLTDSLTKLQTARRWIKGRNPRNWIEEIENARLCAREGPGGVPDP